MENNIYNILNLSNDATDSQIEKRYSELYALYSEQRFKSGEEGNEGARKLTELDESYKEYKQNVKYSYNSGNGEVNFDAIDSLIKQGKYDEAQSALDSIVNRTGEWHYFQSIVFYKRDWFTESRKQLTLALNLDPTNSKYKASLDKLDMVMGNGNVNPNNLGVNPNAQGFANNGQQPKGIFGGNALCDCCAAYCIADCCCSMMRCA